MESARSINVLLLVDTSEGMFSDTQGLPTPFQNAMQAAFNFFDDCMLRIRSSRNNLSVVLRHVVDAERWLIDFEDNAFDAYKKAFTLKSRALNDLRDKFLNSPEAYPLSTCLLDCFRRLPLTEGNRNVIFFMTTTSDPSTSATERMTILSQLHNLHDSITFNVIPYSQSFRPDLFYSEAYASMKRELSNFYFDLDSLTAQLIDQVEYLPRHLKLRMYPYLGSESSITVFLYNPGAKYKIYPSKCATNETREEVVAIYEFDDFEENGQDGDADGDADPSALENRKYSVSIKDNGNRRVIPHATYKALLHTDDFPIGIVLVNARRERYSQDGLGLKMPRLLRCSPWSRNVFKQFWEAHRDLHLLCYIKFRTNCQINCCELSPTLVGNERHFVVRYLPHATNLNIRNMTVDTEEEPSTTVEDVVNAEAVNIRFEQLIEAMTIEFDVRQLRPTDDAKIVEYFKAELLGAQYQPKHVIDYSSERLYPENPRIGELIEELAPSVNFSKSKKINANY